MQKIKEPIYNNEQPADTVRLNSMVTIKDEKENRIMAVMVVVPEKADVKQRKISVMSPIGAALMESRKGQKVSCQISVGTKTLKVLDVSNTIH